MASQDDLKSNQYIIRFESKRWDGKEVWLDSEILDELYNSSELFHGANITVPWKCKGGIIIHWKAVFINPNSPQQGKAC